MSKPTTLIRLTRGIAQIAPWAAAVVCFLYVPSPIWANATGSLVTALSLISAAILVRIMRAFPVTDPDGFSEKSEIASLEYALRRAMQSLSVAVGVAVLAILLLVFRQLLNDVSLGLPQLNIYRGELYSAALGWMTVYVATRIIYAVRADFSILGRQAKAVTRSFEKRKSREIGAARKSKDDMNFRYRDDADYPGRSKEVEH